MPFQQVLDEEGLHSSSHLREKEEELVQKLRRLISR